MSSSETIYHGRDFGPVWICTPCEAWCGCHKQTNVPLGRLANLELRRAKMSVHSVFDPLWQDWLTAYPGAQPPYGHLARIARTRTYRWLAEQLGISFADCHVGMFDVSLCRRTVELIERLKPTPTFIRVWAKARKSEVSR